MKYKIVKTLAVLNIIAAILTSSYTNVYATYADYYTEGNCKENGVYVNNKHEEIKGVLRRGVDVSSAQGKIDWSRVAKDDISFAFIKAGSYMCGVDEQFYNNIKGAKENGIDVGIYIYSYAHNIQMVKKEAEFAVKLAREYGTNLPIAYDIEDRVHQGLNSAHLNSLITTFCNTVRQGGYNPIVYSSRSWFESRIGTDFDEDIWVAQYNDINTLSKPYSFWQITSHGKVDGIEGRVDIDFQFIDYTEDKIATVKNKNAEKLVTGFVNENGVVFYKENGIKATGLKTIDGNLYCFDKINGAMYISTMAEIGNITLSIDESGRAFIIQ